MGSTVEQKLRESEKKHRLLTENIQDSIWVLDTDTLQFTYMSPGVGKLRGYSSEEAERLSLRDTLAPDSYDLAVHTLLSDLAEYEMGAKKKAKLELEMYHKNGSTIWAEVNVQFVREDDGRVKAVGFTRSIDERKMWERLRDELKAELQACQEARERLRKENRVFRRLLPICSKCDKIRDEQGIWNQIEDYIHEHPEADLGYSICPECEKELDAGEVSREEDS